MFPGDNGYLGISKPVEYGGLGLDYSFEIIAAETFASIDCGGIPMAIGVQCDMATPALAKYGSDYVKENFLKPSISGNMLLISIEKYYIVYFNIFHSFSN